MFLKCILSILLILGYRLMCEGVEKSNDICETETCTLIDMWHKIVNITTNVLNEIDAISFAENVPLRYEYDFVIVGAGPSGCVLANRLSEANYSVLLLEAGSAENPIVTGIPMTAPTLQFSEYNWNYETEPQDKACLSMENQRCKWPHGRGLGGSSILNYQIYTRGNRRDFDRIAAAGNPGWNYVHVLPYFQKFEKSIVQHIDYTDSFGHDGLLHIEEARFKSPIARAFVDSAGHLNYTHINYNGGDQIGVAYLQSTTKNGWRQTAARAFLTPAKQRPNLDISLRSWVTKLLFNSHGDHVKAVQFYRNRREYTIKVRKEAILAAGAFESPKILMLSGIGPEEHLEDMNIKVIKNLPVGETLYEHMSVLGPIFTVDNVTDGLVNSNDVSDFSSIFRYLGGNGPLTSTGIEALLYMKTNNSISPDPQYPDVEILQSFETVAFDLTQVTRQGIGLTQAAYDAVYKPLENQRSFQLLSLLLHPRSKGSMKLKSRNPFRHPLFYPNYFNDTRDIDTLLEGIRESIKIVEQPEFQQLGAKLYNASVPGCEQTEFNSDEYWRCYIQHFSGTLHHQVGTCKMGPQTDATAVVDANGRVHGMKNLRVADVSILPEGPSGHTAAFSFLIGEKISDAIRIAWQPKGSNIQKLTRVQRALDWIYQDPAHTTVRSAVDIGATTRPPTTTHRSINQQFMTAITKQTTSLELQHVFHSLNMSVLHANSQQFKNSSIGDVGIILWGSLSAPKTIDFKTKLAENLNATTDEETNTNEMKRRILKPIRRISVTMPMMSTIESDTKANRTDKMSVEMTVTELDMPLNPFTKNASVNFNQTISAENDGTSYESTTIQTTSGMTNMEKILAAAPSIDEDAMKIHQINETVKHNATNEASFHDDKSSIGTMSTVISDTASDSVSVSSDLTTTTTTSTDLAMNEMKAAESSTNY